MKNTVKIILGLLGSFLALFVLAIIYWSVGATVIGPKTEVESFCSAIPAGTTTEELSIISGDHGLQSIYGFEEGQQSEPDINNGTVQVDYQLKNGWICICQVEMKDGEVLHPNDVFCSD